MQGHLCKSTNRLDSVMRLIGEFVVQSTHWIAAFDDFNKFTWQNLKNYTENIVKDA